MFLKVNLKCYSLLRISQWLLITFWINWYTNSLLRCFIRPCTTWILSSFPSSYCTSPTLFAPSCALLQFHECTVIISILGLFPMLCIQPIILFLLLFFHLLCTEKPTQRSAFKVKCLPNTCI